MKKDNMSKKYIIKILLVIFLLGIFLVPSITALKAQSLWDKQIGMDSKAGGDEIKRAFGHTDEPEDIRLIVAKLVSVFLSFLAIIFLVLIVWAGYKWMTAAGNEDQIRDAKKQITTAVIGLAIVMMSYSITVFVTNCVFQVSTEYIWMCGTL